MPSVFKYNNNEIIDSSGKITASAQPKGAVIEQFCSPCDGSSIEVQSGTYTVQDVTTLQSATSTWEDLTGSAITYTPPTGTQTVIYDFEFHACYASSLYIGSFKLLIGGNEVTKARFNDSIQATTYQEHRVHFRWAFHIGGSLDNTTGRQDTWTTGKEIKLQIYEYNSNHQLQVHVLEHWESSGTNQLSLPTIGITALA